jgi:3-phytase
MGSKLAAVAATFAAAAILAAPAAAKGPKTDLEFLGQAIVPFETTFEGTRVGGLSSITYDKRLGVFYAVSDDASIFQPVRYYTVALGLADGRLGAGDVRFAEVTTLLTPGGTAYAPGSLDPEGLALTKDRELIFTSEGIANNLVDPFVRRYALDGTYLGDLPVPADFSPNAERTRGVRHNLGFESAGVAPNGRFLFAATENALVQDGPAATLAGGSPARILRYQLKTGRLDRQWTYVTDAVAEPPNPADAFTVNGLVELLPLNNRFLLAMERSFSIGAPDTGNTILIYKVSLPGRGGTVSKELVLDLEDLDIPLDNVEGMTFGPRLPDGRRSVVLVSDDNFAASQFTQFLLFAIEP